MEKDGKSGKRQKKMRKRWIKVGKGGKKWVEKVNMQKKEEDKPNQSTRKGSQSSITHLKQP